MSVNFVIVEEKSIIIAGDNQWMGCSPLNSGSV